MLVLDPAMPPSKARAVRFTTRLMYAMRSITRYEGSLATSVFGSFGSLTPTPFNGALHGAFASFPQRWLVDREIRRAPTCR